MFFPRLRRQAKWAFAFMVLVFGLGFVLLGVGSGSGGIGDLLQGHFGNVFGGGRSAGPSISNAQAKVAKHPGDARAYRELATAYEGKQRSVDAIGALKRYTALKPKDQSALEELASLQLSRADGLRQRASALYQEQQQATLGQSFGPPPTSKLGQALGTDPITQALSTGSSGQFTTAYASMQTAYGEAVGTYKRLATLQPDVASIQEELALAANSGGDAKTAVAAFRRYLKLAPDASDAPAVKQQIKQLQAQSALSTAPPGK